MNENLNNEDKILGRTSELETIFSEKIDEYNTMFKTKDIYLVAFLLSRGETYIGYEQREVIKTYLRDGKSFNNRQRWIYFFFPNEKSACDKLEIQFRNPNRINLNVNASSYYQSILNVRSIITDPHFPKG